MAQKKLRCYLYTRVSTQMQVDGYSLDAQQDRLKKEAAHRSMQVVATFSDEGRSGKNTTGRPQFQAMMQRIQNGNEDHVDYVLVFKLSRFGRNAADVLNNLQIMQDFGVNLICVEDGIDSASAAGKILFPVLAGVAELERENIQAQTMAGRWQKAREGKWNGGQAPYGYRIEDGMLIIEESEAALVRLIFEKYVQSNMGINGVAKWLNENGYSKQTRQNGIYSRISATFVKGVVDNPVYAGKIAYGRRKSEKIEGTRNEYHTVKQAEFEIFDGKHEAIIPDDLWQAAQVKRGLNAYKREKRYSPEHAHILSGLVKCPVCGAPMYGVVNRKKKKDGSGEFYSDMWYYICRNTKTVSGQRCTYTKHIRQDDVNEQVRRVVQEALRNMDFTQDIMKSIGTDANLDALQAEVDTLAATKKKEERQKSKLLSKIMELDADDELYDEMYDDLQGLLRQRMIRISELDSKINQVSIAIQNAGSKAATAEEVYATMRIIVDMMDIMPERDEQEIMHALLDSVQIYPERQPNGLWIKSVRFKVPLEFDGVSSQDVIIDNDDNSLPNASNDETVVLLTERPLVLVEPCGKYLESYLEAREEGRENGMASDDFSSAPAGELLKRYDDFRCGRDLPPGWVAADYYWLVDEDKNRFIGEIGIRHGLTEALRRYGGHIGYAVRPSEWNKGHGTLMLGLALEKARDLGITTAMITCDDDNAASARVMEKNGFTLLDRVTNTVDGRTVITRRYTKNLSPGPAGKGAV